MFEMETLEHLRGLFGGLCGVGKEHDETPKIKQII
jgi:hypothetical protein